MFPFESEGREKLVSQVRRSLERKDSLLLREGPAFLFSSIAFH